MNYGYIRVSTDRQTVENQRYEIIKFCKENNLSIDGWIEETISGGRSCNERRLGELLSNVRKNDIIICAELSRLGRELFMIINILNLCMEKQCHVWTIKENYRLGEDIQSKVLGFCFSLIADIERSLIKQRTTEALQRLKANGMVLGRPCGKKGQTNRKCNNQHDNIVEWLKRGIKKKEIARRVGVGNTTLYRYLAYTNLYRPKRGKDKDWNENCIYR